MEFDALGFGVCILSGIACFWLFYKCIIMFGYLMYVLVKPEKF